MDQVCRSAGLVLESRFAIRPMRASGWRNRCARAERLRRKIEANRLLEFETFLQIEDVVALRVE